MKTPSAKQVDKIKTVLEDIIKRPVVAITVDTPLVSLLFPSTIKIPPAIGTLRSDLMEQGFLLFYSMVVYKKTPMLSFNITKQ